MCVDDVALFKGFVELKFANDAAQTGLSQLRDGNDVIGRAIAGKLGIGDLEIQNAIDLQLRVVARDANLTGHIEWNFFEAVLLDDFVNEGHHKVKSRCEACVVLAQSLNHPGVLLRHDLDGFDDEQDRNGQKDDCNFHDVSF